MSILTPAQRLERLHAIRDLKMARSAHAYVRGNTRRFYEWLAASPVASIIPQGPPVWICGDCHLGNMGALADSDGRVAIQIRDFDQAVIGNPAHDLIRLGLSLQTAARGSDLPGVVTARMLEGMIEGYEQAFTAPYGQDAPKGEPKAVRTVRREAMGRKWRHLARDRLENARPTIPLGERFWPMTEEEWDALQQALTQPAVSHMILALDPGGKEGEPRLIDAAFWRKGCSSLGLRRYAAVVEVEGREGTGYALIDFKEATAPVAPPAPGAVMPQDPATRVVAAARALSPHLGERMATTHMLGHAMFLREIRPQDMKIEVEQFSHGEALKAARYLAHVVGQAHARQMNAATRHQWIETLRQGHPASLDAPSWLWQAVVAMAGRHETGYLDHCRLYALAH